MRRPHAIWLAFSVLVLSCAACRLPALSRQTASGELLVDDFSSATSGWEQGEYDTGAVGYRDGAYFVSSTGGGNPMWGVAFTSFSDVTVSVDTTQISAPDNDNNAYGVVCREQGDGSGYYLMISGDGGFAIFLATEDGFEPLVDWTLTDVVLQGNAKNHIEATCSGPILELVVNGTRLGTAEDTTFTKGDVALTVTSYERDQPSEVLFDNLVITRPTRRQPTGDLTHYWAQ